MTAASSTHARVLVADNSVASQGVLVILLEGAGFDVINVRDGAQAMAAVRAHAFDLAILDHEMPNLDDVGALVELRTTLPDLPVIICASSLTPGQIARYRELGVTELLTKPVDPHVICETVIRILGHRHPHLATAGGSTPPFRNLHASSDSSVLSPLAAGPSRYARKLQTELLRMRDFKSVAIIEGRLGSGRFELALSLAPASNVHTFVCPSDEMTPEHLDRLFKPSEATEHPVFFVVLEADRLNSEQQTYLENLLCGRVAPHASFVKRLRVVLCARTSLCDLHFNELLLMRGVTATLQIPDFVDRWMDWAEIARAILRRVGTGRGTIDPEAIRWINRYVWKGDYMQLHRVMELARRRAGVGLTVTTAHLEWAASAEPSCNDPLFHDLLFHVHSGS
jgi:DNA-binding NtrC family response regulator